MPTKSGHLVLADISGYTAFVADTELEHSREILNELLETIVRCLAEHLAIGQIEGDAIFALGERLPADPVAWLEDCFFRFHRHLNRIKEVTTCPCKACANVGVLTLKFVCHWGEYLPQTFANKETYVGNAVNVVHRLLKNKVPSREYVLVTEAALERFPAALRSHVRPHREEYDLGGIDCGWLDLSGLRKDKRARDEVKVVDDAHAEIRDERVANAPKDVVWTVLTDPKIRQRWMGVQRVDYKPGARHTLVGGEYHCIHGAGQETVFRVGEAIEPDRLTVVVPMGPGIVAWITTQLEVVDDRRTKIVTRWRLDRPPGPLGTIKGFVTKQMLKKYVSKYSVAIPREAEALASGGRAAEAAPV
jgi:uncharacterized protein YndB with AHSA1/START domain/class 3 adenylate cyclase